MKKLTHSKSKAQWWRMGLIWGFILAFGVINFGCEKNADESYIKYTVGVQAKPYYVPIDIVIRNEHDEITPYSDTDSWNITLGPVKKRFHCVNMGRN